MATPTTTSRQWKGRTRWKGRQKWNESTAKATTPIEGNNNNNIMHFLTFVFLHISGATTRQTGNSNSSNNNSNNNKLMVERMPTVERIDSSSSNNNNNKLVLKCSTARQVDGQITTIPPSEAVTATAAPSRGTGEGNVMLPPAEAAAAVAALTHESVKGETVLPTVEAAAATAAASHESEEGKKGIPTAEAAATATAVASSAATPVHETEGENIIVPLAYVAAAAAMLSPGGEAGNTLLPTAAVTPGDVDADPPLSAIFENESEYKVHVEAMRRHLEACLQNRGSEGFSAVLTDKFISAVSQDLQSKATCRIVPVVLGAIPRAIDVMVNLFLSDSGDMLSKKVDILDGTKLTICFNDYKMKDKWHTFQRGLGYIIQTGDSASRIEYTCIKGEDELPIGKLHAKTILKYMKVYLSLFWWDINSVEFPPAPPNTDQGPFFYRRFQDDATGPSVELAPSTQSEKCLILDWPIDVSKRELAFWKFLMSLSVQFQQRTRRIFVKVKLDHFVDEAFCHDKLQHWILTVTSTPFFKACGTQTDFEQLSTKQNIFVADIKALLQQLILTLCSVDNFVSMPNSIQMLNTLCGKFLNNVLTSWLSRDPTVEGELVDWSMAVKSIVNAVFDTPEIILNLDTTIKKMDIYLKAECKQLLKVHFDGGFHNDWLYIYTMSGKSSIQFDERTPPDLLRGVHVPGFHGHSAADIAKWDFLKKQHCQWELFNKHNDTYSVEWLMLTSKDNNGVRSLIPAPRVDDSAVDDLSQEELPAYPLNDNGGDPNK
eukprot:jgi/Psemu1/48295/gm1.48295_g